MKTRTATGGTVRRLATLAAAAALGACAASHTTGSTSTTSHAPSTKGTGSSTSAPTTTATTASATTSTSAAGGSTTTTLPAGKPVPAGFALSSVSFPSPDLGFALGSVTCGARTCAVLARTTDGGRSWSTIGAPPVSSPNGVAPGAAAVRFADDEDGWVFDWPETGLWATHDGGARWFRPTWTVSGGLSGDEVTDVEVADGTVRAGLVGAGGVVVESSPVQTESWTASPVLVHIGAGPIPVAQLAVSGSAAWLIENDRGIVGGARLAGGAWTAWSTPASCEGTSDLAASSPQDLVLVCSQGLYVQTAAQAFFSDDGGATLVPAPTLPTSHGDLGPFGYGAPVGSPGPGSLVAGVTNNGGSHLVATFDGGHSWQTVAQNPVSASGTWTDVAFVSSMVGFAVAEGQSGTGPYATGALLETTDGGQHWSVVPITTG